jgi:putative transposase
MLKTTHSVYALYYHIILTVKYRKPLLDNNIYDNFVKQEIHQVAIKNNFSIEEIESDRDHIHILILAPPKLSAYRIVSLIKQHTTYEVWQKYSNQLQKEFWKKHVFWTRSNFVASIGSVSKEAIQRYIQNQGSSSATLKR